MIEDQLHKQESMTFTEKKIADYFLQVQDKIKAQSAHQIASQLYVHPSMITRFCQKLGFQGYNDFQNQYIEEIQYRQTHFQTIDPNYPFAFQDKNVVIANKIGQLYHEIINDTLALISHDQLQKIVNAVLQAKTIYIYSAGVQADLAQTFKDKMIKIGKNVVVEKRMNELFYRASFCQQNCLFVIISYSGEVEAELRGIRKLTERHIPLLAITTYGENSLSKAADFVFWVSTRERMIQNLGDFAFNLSTLLILDILYVNVFNSDYNDHYQKKVSASQEFELFRKSDNALIK